MATRFVGLVSFIYVFLFSTPVFSAPPDIPAGLLNEANNSFIFIFNDNVAADDVPSLANGLAQQANGTVRKTFKSAVKGFSANMSATAAANLAANNPDIAYYEQNGVAGIAGKAVIGKGPKKPPAEPPPLVEPWGIGRVGGPVDGTGSVVCVIDSGIDTGNDDFNIDTVNGRNFVNNAKKPDDIKDKNGHGTHVSGTLAAKDDGIGVMGVAAGATIVPLKVFGASGQGFVDDIVEAVNYVAENVTENSTLCSVVNMSLNAYGQFDSLDNAVANTAALGVKFAVCAGNESDNADNYSPAAVNHSNVATIAAIEINDNFADFSNYGDSVDYAAPGVDVESYVLNGDIQSWYGCSMATPHVAGIMLLGDVMQDGTANNSPDNGIYPIAHF